MYLIHINNYNLHCGFGFVCVFIFGGGDGGEVEIFIWLGLISKYIFQLP